MEKLNIWVFLFLITWRTLAKFFTESLAPVLHLPAHVSSWMFCLCEILHRYVFCNLYCKSFIKCPFSDSKIKTEICQNNQILEKLVHLSTLCLGQLQCKFLCSWVVFEWIQVSGEYYCSWSNLHDFDLWLVQSASKEILPVMSSFCCHSQTHLSIFFAFIVKQW